MINKRHKQRVDIAIDIVQYQGCSTCNRLFNFQNGGRITEGEKITSDDYNVMPGIYSQRVNYKPFLIICLMVIKQAILDYSVSSNGFFKME